MDDYQKIGNDKEVCCRCFANGGEETRWVRCVRFSQNSKSSDTGRYPIAIPWYRPLEIMNLKRLSGYFSVTP